MNIKCFEGETNLQYSLIKDVFHLHFDQSRSQLHIMSFVGQRVLKVEIIYRWIQVRKLQVGDAINNLQIDSGNKNVNRNIQIQNLS